MALKNKYNLAELIFAVLVKEPKQNQAQGKVNVEHVVELGIKQFVKDHS